MSQYLRRFVLIGCSSALLSCALITAASAQSVAPDIRDGGPQDWSHRHLIYANPDTRDEAARKGTLAFEEWKRKSKDPRFAQQVARKQRFVEPTQANPFSPQQLQWFQRHDRNPPATGQEVHRDWSNVMGGVSGVGSAGVFPAKYGPSFTIADCTNDFVVYPTASVGATSSGTFATQAGSFSSNPAAGGKVTITHTGSPPLALIASATLNLGLNFQIGATTTDTATNLANAIVRNGGTAGVTATSSANSVIMRAITAGATGGNTTLLRALTNFTWTGTGATSTTLTNPNGGGTAGQPTIIAFNQLYSSCGTSATQAVPNTFWSYNTGNGTLVQTSPVLSLDGTQVAFVQGTGATGSTATLVVLKWSSASPGTVGVPTVPTISATNAAYRTCTAPCMWTIALNGAPANTNSSPYYDYAGDVLYVGDDSGKLHKFTGVFSGTPAEQVTGGFPATVSTATGTGKILTSPVYDSVSGLVFVGSTIGKLHSVNATSGAVVSSGQLAYTGSAGITDSPIVDSTAKKAYVFVGGDVAVGTDCAAGIIGTNPCFAIYQFSTTFAANNIPATKVQVGQSYIPITRAMFAGAFDNTYYNSADGTNPSGYMYVCGGSHTAGSMPTLWKIPLSNNAMTAPSTGPVLVTTFADCSAVTEIYNSGLAKEYIYAGVTANGTQVGGCNVATGCVYMADITAGTWSTAQATITGGIAAPGGASGIIVDNISSTTGASQIYYSTLTSPGNAVQASQAGLQ